MGLTTKCCEPPLSGLNESPSEKEGKCGGSLLRGALHNGLNESPSEKEGKSVASVYSASPYFPASMKAPPKRKGNGRRPTPPIQTSQASMKAPPKRKGNLPAQAGVNRCT